MFLKQLLSYLLFFALLFLPDTGAQIIVRAFKGEAVHLPCHLLPDKSNANSIEWRKNGLNGLVCAYVLNYVNKTSSEKCLPRFTFNKETYNLRIENVQHSDFGNYTCKNMRIIPPPSIEIITHVTLHVEDLSLQRLNNSNVSCIHLICALEALNPEQVNITWTREGQRLPHLSSGSDTSSELYLCKPDWHDKDEITCQTSYIYNYTTMFYNRTILLNLNPDSPDKPNLWLLIIACSVSAGIIFILVFCAVFCKYRKRRDANGSTVFSNKVYENFSFAMARSTVKQSEECVYEN